MKEYRGRAYDFFELICKIPRQSGDEERISSFMMDFAAERGLEAKRDRQNNVLIKKPSSIPGYRGPAVIIQGHMDMVYVKETGSNHVYEDGIRLKNQGGYLSSAEGTSLGADNGVALAYAMDLLDQKEIMLPDLEVLLTTEEEVGLAGVKNMELTGLRGKYLINLDAEEEGVFFTSCAGGVRSELELPLEYEYRDETVKISLSLEGLSGGHSGMEIGFEKANAVKLLGRILSCVNGVARVSSMECPGKANAIAANGSIVLYTSDKERDCLMDRLTELESILKKEFIDTDQIAFSIHEERGNFRKVSVLSEKTVTSVMRIITFLPCGAVNRTYENPSMVETSSNIGDLSVKNGKMIFLSSSRSSVKSRKEELKDRIQMIGDTFDAGCKFYGEYPQWEYRKDSKLREICREVYRRSTGNEPVFSGIHAGIECGYLAEKLGSDIDMISFGATLKDVHTPRETLSLESFYNTEAILIEILKELSLCRP